jgi:hypothetical protein
MPKVVIIGATGHILTGIALFLSLTFSPPVKAEKLPSILGSGIERKDSRPNETTYYFSLQVGDKPLSQVIIDLPMGVDIQRWIDVADDNNRPVGSSYERIGQKAIINFAKPIAIATQLNFYIHGIQAKTSQTWKLPISVQLKGNQEPILIGKIHIKM